MTKKTNDKQTSADDKAEAVDQVVYEQTSDVLPDGEQSSSENSSANAQSSAKKQAKERFTNGSQRLNKVIDALKSGSAVLKEKSGDGAAKVKALYRSKPRYFLVGGVVVIGLLAGSVLAASMSGHSVPNEDKNAVSAKSSQAKTTDNTSAIAEQMQQKSVADTQMKQAEELKKQLSAIQDEIKDSNQSNQQLKQLHSQMAALSQAVEKVQQSADQARAAAQQSIAASQSSAKAGQAQVAKVETQIEAIHKQLSPQNYLPVSNLPFEVVGSGYWGNQLMVTIAMKDVNGGYHYRLMGEGQQFNCTSFAWKVPSCSNWNLKNISNDPATAIFVNAQNPKKRVKAEL